MVPAARGPVSCCSLAPAGCGQRRSPVRGRNEYLCGHVQNSVVAMPCLISEVTPSMGLSQHASMLRYLANTMLRLQPQAPGSVRSGGLAQAHLVLALSAVCFGPARSRMPPLLALLPQAGHLCSQTR